MIRAIKNILEKLGCKHQWTQIYETRVHDGFGGEYTRLTFTCDICGKFHKRKV